MKKKTTATTPPPAFDPASAVACEPTRDGSTGRTFCFVQGAHLFSATGDYIATRLEKKTPAPKPKPDLTPEPAPAAAATPPPTSA